MIYLTNGTKAARKFDFPQTSVFNATLVKVILPRQLLLFYGMGQMIFQNGFDIHWFVVFMTIAGLKISGIPRISDFYSRYQTLNGRYSDKNK